MATAMATVTAMATAMVTAMRMTNRGTSVYSVQKRKSIAQALNEMLILAYFNILIFAFLNI